MATDAVFLLLEGLAAEPACLVSVQSTQGSAPREAGTWMAVFAGRTIGTIGGGHLELQAIAEARRRLGGADGPPQVRYPLGPALGQCCGGVVVLAFERLARGSQADAAGLRARLAAPQCPVALFGGGHVGYVGCRVGVCACGTKGCGRPRRRGLVGRSCRVGSRG